MAYKLRFAFAVPGLPFQGDTLETKSLGGSETAALCLMRELAEQGHTVSAFTNTDKPGVYNGVRYFPLSSFRAFATGAPHDVCVIQRLLEYMTTPFESKLNVLWCHDLALKREAQKFRGVMWNIDRVAVVSEWMAKQYEDVYNIDRKDLYVTRNGIDLDLFQGLPSKRDPKSLIWTSRPERGLDVLATKIFPALLERDPELKLYIAGYENPVEHLNDFYNGIAAELAKFGDRVVKLGYLTKRELYKRYARTGCLVYPTPSPIAPTFNEVSCITAMEAQACGLPFVSSARGALPETLAKGAGTLIEADPASDEYVSEFCDAVMTHLANPGPASEAGREKAKSLSWADVARDWANDCEEFIAQNNDDKERLARHFIRRSNILLAKKLASEIDSPELSKRLETWDFHGSKEAYKDQYEKIGLRYAERFPNGYSTWEAGSSEGRLHYIIGWLKKHPEIHTVLDIGCGAGIYAINISNALPHIKITGVDIDKTTIGWAEKFHERYAEHPENVKFVISDESVDLKDFDCVLACEILEHVPEPWSFIETVEAKAKKGGHVFMTCPFGPWEALSYDRPDYVANHLWEFEPTDLEDMLKAKKDFANDLVPLLRADHTLEPIGNFHFNWIADHKPIPPIDLGRKLKIQRPRQTISACIIAGGEHAEETAHWCMKSLRTNQFVDEIIVADCGMTEEAKRIVSQYADKIVPAPDPKVVGFQEPRNLILDHAKMDWILWIDLDEKLLGTAELHKYLRKNCYYGYSIFQHHFSCDSNFKPDMPVRMFRRKRRDGKEMKFIGCIHEHPETALNEGPGDVLVLTDVHIAHVGYLVETIRRKRFDRNAPMLAKDMEVNPERLLQKHFMMRDNMLRVGYMLQMTGGKITDEMRKLAQEVCEIYREYFLGKKQYANINSLQYYTSALELLGEGIQFEVGLKAARDGRGDEMSGDHVRFANVEEALTELSQRLKEKVEPLTGDYW